MNGGFISLQREAIDHPMLQEPVKFRAWVWLLSKAVWKPTPFNVNGTVITLQRGQICVSVRALATAWGMSKSATDRFLDRLKIGTMIETKAGHGKLVITICNYGKYQYSENCERDTSGTVGGTRAGHERDIKEKGNNIIIEPNGSSDLANGQDCVGQDVPAKPMKADIDEAFNKWKIAAAQKGWPVPRELTDGRKRKLAARLKAYGSDAWADALRQAYRSPVLAANPPPGWFSFDWIIKSDENMLKLIEGNYSRSFAPQAAPEQDFAQRVLARHRA